ncbi:VTT domain-containing protein [Peribacillus kribbensis]|uniref:VTT domain-containing protein n=1 Tax=Peribacillus kribbensis TaxID=356658 RepID=UPI00047DCF88
MIDLQQHISLLIEHYGYGGIMIALVAGIVGLPLPDEVLLAFVGFQVYKGDMLFLPSVLSAFIGAAGGISLSYLLGIKLGLPFIHRYGPRLHLTEKKLDSARKSFIKFGPILLFFGYFIPGFRHITAYLAGINGYSYQKFSKYAYTGAFLWTLVFITLGRSLGREWIKADELIARYSIPLLIIAVLAIGIGLVIWNQAKAKKTNEKRRQT